MNFISGQFLDKLHVIPEAQAVTLDFKSPVTYETKPPKVQNEEGSGHLDNIQSTEASETTSPGYISVLFHLQEHFQKYCLIWKARRPRFSPCLTCENPGGIILARSGPDLWVKSQGSEVITPAQTSASGQIMSGVKVWHASLLGPWGGEPLNQACTQTLACVCRRELNHVLVE